MKRDFADILVHLEKHIKIKKDIRGLVNTSMCLESWKQGCIMCNDCGNCGKAKLCGKLKKIIISHKISLYEFTPFAEIGLIEMYGDAVMAKVFRLLDRFRKFNGYVYFFKSESAGVYKRGKDLPENSFSRFVLNPISGFYEFDLCQDKRLPV